MKTIFAILILWIVFVETALAVEYKIIDLGTLGGGRSEAWGINEVGQISGYSSLSDGSWRAVKWEVSGGIQDLGTISGNVSSARGGINDAGQIVGKSTYPEGILLRQHAFVWNDKEGFIDIDTLGTSSEAFGINNLGHVVGRAYNPIYGDTHAFYWSQTGGMVDIGPYLPFPSESGAYGINELDQVVGYSHNINGYSRAFLWDSVNGMEDIGTLGGNTSIARSINSLSQIVGNASRSSGYTNAFFWDNVNGMISLGTLGGNESNAWAINSFGKIVGCSQIDETSTQHAFIYEDGIMKDLNTLIDPSIGWIIDYAMDINDSGQIVGRGYKDGEFHAYLMEPIPEPATLLILAFEGLMLRKRR